MGGLRLEQKKITIFGAEDEKLLRKLLARMLGQMMVKDELRDNPEVPHQRLMDHCLEIGMIFTTCEELIAHLEQLPPEALHDILLITDHLTPGSASGADVAAFAIKHGLPYLVITGTPDPYLQAVEALLSPDQYKVARDHMLLKPFSPDTLRTAVNGLLAGLLPQASTAALGA